MGNEYGAADLQPHLAYGLTVPYVLDWATATGTFTVLGGGYHQKMRLRALYIINLGADLNATEPVIDVEHGGNTVIASVDMATGMSATAVIGEVHTATVVDQYKDLEPEDALQINVTTADGGADTRGLFLFLYELVE